MNYKQLNQGVHVDPTLHFFIFLFCGWAILKFLYAIIVKQKYQDYHDYHDYCFHSIFMKSDYKHVKLFLNVCKNGKNCYK